MAASEIIDERARESMQLLAISPIDGRYADRLSDVSEHASEFAYIKHRVRVEIEYLLSLAYFLRTNRHGHLDALLENGVAEKLRALYENFSLDDALAVKRIEKTTRHDLKAIEYWIKEKMDAMQFAREKEWVHFALTSHDANNLAVAHMAKCVARAFDRKVTDFVIAYLDPMARDHARAEMLAHTHGQPATPTTFGFQMAVFLERLLQLSHRVDADTKELSVKFAGATGGFNAHLAAFPHCDWQRFADRFVTVSLGFHRREQHTTQIGHYDTLCSLFTSVFQVNCVLIDMCEDVWQYVTKGYLTLKSVPHSIGSSTMPHKINPVGIENAVRNFKLSNSMLQTLFAELPVSKLQRDIGDSTLLRNVGSAFAYASIALDAMTRDFARIVVERDVMRDELDSTYLVLAEALQTVLRREGVEAPYEKVKAHIDKWRGEWNRSAYEDFVRNVGGIGDETRDKLLSLTPGQYLGSAPDI